MRRLTLIRHGLTEGNVRRWYYGALDLPLCEAGADALREAAAAGLYPPIGQAKILTSGLLRTEQTLRLLYGDVPHEVWPDLREISFGIFEGKSYDELNGRADSQAFIDSGGEAPVPGGESRAQFAARCVRAGMRLMELSAVSDCALVAHGGTIMALMEKYARPAGGYFDFQVGNAQGFILEADGRYRPLFSQAPGERCGKATKP